MGQTSLLNLSCFGVGIWNQRHRDVRLNLGQPCTVGAVDFRVSPWLGTEDTGIANGIATPVFIQPVPRGNNCSKLHLFLSWFWGFCFSKKVQLGRWITLYLNKHNKEKRLDLPNCESSGQNNTVHVDCDVVRTLWTDVNFEKRVRIFSPW